MRENDSMKDDDEKGTQIHESSPNPIFQLTANTTVRQEMVIQRGSKDLHEISSMETSGAFPGKKAAKHFT
jgi:putative salt-induced outer membrane protein YdiY